MDNDTLPVDPTIEGVHAIVDATTDTPPTSETVASPPVVDETVHTIEHRSFGRPAGEPMVVTVITTRDSLAASNKPRA